MHSSDQPQRYERAHPDDLQLATSIRSFPFTRWAPNTTWREHVRAIADERNGTVLHLTGLDAGWRIAASGSARPQQYVPVLRAVLERAVQLRTDRMATPLTAPESECVEEAHRQLGMYGNAGSTQYRLLAKRLEDLYAEVEKLQQQVKRKVNPGVYNPKA
jgi:HPt (histidine-containing phosphotransfer) domain-containing protein